MIVIQIITEYMRKIINISLPKELDSKVNKMIKEGNFATKSEFFRDLLRMKIEGRLIKELAESRKELVAGKGKLLKSLKELR